MSGSVAVTVGQVNFCDASAKYCTDIHLLGTAQLTSAGTAVLKFIPGIGSHSYKAVFAGTPHGATAYAGSASSAVALSVTGAYKTTTAITASGSNGNYSLTATVTGLVNAPSLSAPAGTVSFLDTTNNNNVLGTAALGTGIGVTFFNSATPVTYNQPQSVTVADFNGDGILDLAVTAGCCAMNILLGNGNGTFTAGPGVPLTGYNTANNAAVADFNGDGIPDLALSFPNDNKVLVLLGNGDGTFNPMPPISASGVFRVGTGDFNGDGKADLFVLAGDTLTIQLGNGDGTFTALVPITLTGPFPYSVAVGDFNGDGIPDLAVANDTSPGIPGSVTILLGNGDGTFTLQAESPVTGDSPVFIVAGDFNGDGILDLAVANSYTDIADNEPGTVTVLLGNGDGTFAPTAVSPVTGSLPYSLAVGDFNGDGIADLVTADSASNTATVLLGNGDGTFAAPLTLAVATNPLSVAVGDFNDDGLMDLAVLSEMTNSMSILLAQDTQTATANATGISPVGTGTHMVQANYPGESSFAASISSTVGLIAVPSPSFTISRATVTLARGATTGNTSIITVTPAGGFTGSVSLTAAITSSPSGAQDLPTLSFGSTTPVIITSTSGAVTATLTISTTAPTSAALAHPARPGVRWYTGCTTLAFGLIFGIGIGGIGIGIPARRRSWRTRLVPLVFLVVLLAGGFLACSSGGSGGGGNPGTTPGNYVVTVTATSGSITQTGTVNLTVQ